jgi:hypothetical protein
MAPKWLNTRRLHDYPWLFLIASWTIVILNVLLHDGWIGGLTGILLGGDFISNYAGGLLYRTDLAHLYDPAIQQEIMEEIVFPSQPPGFAPYISTPSVALAYSPLTFLPVGAAFLLWTLLMLICLSMAVYLINRFMVPAWLVERGLNARQLAVILAGCFAFVDGTQAGQSHALSLLLVVGIVITTQKERWFLAGLLAALLTYKPQYVIGFLIIWLVWRRWQALLAFGFSTLVWQLAVMLPNGITPFLNYLDFTGWLLYLPFTKGGFPISVMATPYALAASLLPINTAPLLQIVFIALGIVLALWLGLIALRAYRRSPLLHNAALAAAVLFPLLTMPHALLYDLLLLVPAFLLLVDIQGTHRSLLNVAVFSYLGTLFLPLLGYPLKIALPALIPLAFFAAQARNIWRATQA